MSVTTCRHTELKTTRAAARSSSSVAARNLETIVLDFSQKYSLAVRPSIVGGLENDDLDTGDTDLVLKVRTTDWGLTTFNGDWSHARVIYQARVDLIDARTKKSVARGECEFTPAKGTQPPTFDEMLANGAATLKSELSRVERLCFNKFRDQLLALGP